MGGNSNGNPRGIPGRFLPNGKLPMGDGRPSPSKGQGTEEQKMPALDIYDWRNEMLGKPGQPRPDAVGKQGVKDKKAWDKEFAGILDPRTGAQLNATYRPPPTRPSTVQPQLPSNPPPLPPGGGVNPAPGYGSRLTASPQAAMQVAALRGG